MLFAIGIFLLRWFSLKTLFTHDVFNGRLHMKAWKLLPLLVGFLVTCTALGVQEAASTKAHSEIARWIVSAKQIAAEPELIKAVAAQNLQLPAEYADMTQIKWAALAELDPLVTALCKNAAARVLKARKTAGLSEIFVSDKEGRKVAFLAKPTNWSHEGKPKHEQPMKGEVWEGRVEHDESTGLMQVQVAVPVLQDDKPIGSLVIGVELDSLGTK